MSGRSRGSSLIELPGDQTYGAVQLAVRRPSPGPRPELPTVAHAKVGDWGKGACRGQTKRRPAEGQRVTADPQRQRVRAVIYERLAAIIKQSRNETRRQRRHSHLRRHQRRGRQRAKPPTAPPRRAEVPRDSGTSTLGAEAFATLLVTCPLRPPRGNSRATHEQQRNNAQK